MAKKARKINLVKLHELALKGNSITDMAKYFGVTEVSIHNAISENFPHLLELETFKKYKADYFRSLQLLACKTLLDKIPSANTKDLTYLIAVLEDKIAQLEGKSSNTLIGIKIENLVMQKENLLSSLKEQGVPDSQLDKEFQKLISLPAHASLPLEDLKPSSTSDNRQDIQDI